MIHIGHSGFDLLSLCSLITAQFDEDDGIIMRQ